MSYSGRNNLRDESDTLFAARSLWILRRHCKSCETVQVLCVCLSSSSLALGRSLRSQDLLCSFRTMLYGLLYRPQGVPAVSVCHIPHSRQRCQLYYTSTERPKANQPYSILLFLLANERFTKLIYSVSKWFHDQRATIIEFQSQCNGGLLIVWLFELVHWAGSFVRMLIFDEIQSLKQQQQKQKQQQKAWLS